MSGMMAAALMDGQRQNRGFSIMPDRFSNRI
jgi:hypothetical protein